MSDDELKTIILTGDDGNDIECQLVDIIEFKGQDYAILLYQEELVFLRYLESEEGSQFQHIEDDAEFEKVSAFIQALADEM